MKDAGYLTYHHGKRGNTAPLIQAKFEVNKYLKNDEAERRSGEPGKEIVDDAIAFLEAKQDPRPVFMYLAFGNPHDPRVAAKKYLDQYDPDKLPLPKNFLPVHPFDNGELVVRDEQLLPWPRTAADVRRTLHEYYATVTALDFHIGRLIRALEDPGQLDNTLVIFSADQGIAVGSHGLLGKQNLYDHSMKAPLVLAGPGIPRGRSDALVYLFDIYPTVCDLVGAKVPEEIDGRSFRPVLDGKATTARPELMLAYRGKQRAVRDERWKLIRYPEVNVTQLFDLQIRSGRDQEPGRRPGAAGPRGRPVAAAREAPEALRRRPAAHRREPPTRRARDARATPARWRSLPAGSRLIPLHGFAHAGPRSILPVLLYKG